MRGRLSRFRRPQSWTGCEASEPVPRGALHTGIDQESKGGDHAFWLYHPPAPDYFRGAIDHCATREARQMLDSEIRLLRDFPARLKAHLEIVDPPALDFAPGAWDGIPSESLTIRQQICHLRDIETDGYGVRFARVLAEDSPFLSSIDTYALVGPRGYDETDLQAAFDEFARARAVTLRTLSAASPADFRRTGEFEGYGPVSLVSLVHYLISHDEQHLAGIHWLLGKIASVQR